MNMIDLNELKTIRDGAMDKESQAQHDRHMYLQGREAYPTLPEDTLPERDRGCYMMGYNVSEWESER